jgi:hypothetical protein
MTATAVPNRIGTGFSLSLVDRFLRKRIWLHAKHWHPANFRLAGIRRL